MANDLEPLYSVTDGELALPDHAAALPEDSLYVKVPRQREVMVSFLSGPLHVAPRALCSCFFSLPCYIQVMVTPDLRIFRTLFRCFCGRVADLQLPPGAFFTGSAVVAAATLPTRLLNNDLMETLLDCGSEEEEAQIAAAMTLRRGLRGKKPLVRHVQGFLGAMTDLFEVREDVADDQPDPEHTSFEEDDVLQWTDRGGKQCPPL